MMLQHEEIHLNAREPVLYREARAVPAYTDSCTESKAFFLCLLLHKFASETAPSLY